MEENTDEIRELIAQLVQAQTLAQVELIDKKLAVLKKYDQQ